MKTLMLIVLLLSAPAYAQIYNPPPLPPPNVGQRESQRDFWQRQEQQRDQQQRYYDQYMQDQQLRRRLDALEWES